MSKELWTTQEIADFLGVKRRTISAYKSRGQMPKEDIRYGVTPLWKTKTLKAWKPKKF